MVYNADMSSSFDLDLHVQHVTKFHISIHSDATYMT